MQGKNNCRMIKTLKSKKSKFTVLMITYIKMKQWHYLIMCLINSIIIVSCSNDDGCCTLNESEYYSNERLASISYDNDSVCWLGTEYGKVCRLTDNGWKTFDVADDRIYFVKHIGNNYWVGVRNDGVQCYRFNGTNFLHQHSYPITVKQTNYSAYDMVAVKKQIFVGTSQGLFTLNNDTATQLKLIYPSKLTPCHIEGQTCVVRKLQQINNRTLVAATDNGLLHIDIPSGKITISHKGRKIDDILFQQGTLYILSGNTFEIKKSTIQHTYSLPFTASAFYIAEGVYCFLSVNVAHLTVDLSNFKKVHLRRDIPINSTHVVISDKKKSAMLLVTDNALWHVPMHLDLFSSNVPVVAACVDNNYIWYVNAKNEVFMQKKNENKAAKMYDFIDEAPIIDIAVKDDMLFYTTSRREVKRRILYKQLWRNYLNFQTADTYLSKDKITAITLDVTNNNKALLVGIQDGLLSFKSPTFQPDTISYFNDKYISSFYQPNGSRMIYMSTLNNGMIVKQNATYEPMKNVDIVKGMRGVAMSDKYPPLMLVLAGNKLYLEGTKDSLDATGISKILMPNDTTIYALKDFGLQRYALRHGKLVENGQFFRDICFHPKASFTDNGEIYLGCNLGVLRFRALHENQPQWVEVQYSMVSRLTVIIFFVSLLLISLLTWIGIKIQRRLNIRHILTQKTDLNTRIADLLSICQLLPMCNDSDIKQLKNDLKNINPYKKVAWKNIYAQLAYISKLIMQKNRNMVLPLMKYVDEQRTEILSIDLYNSKQLAQATANAFASGSIERIRLQAIENNKWLGTIKNITTRLDMYIENLNGTLLLPNISDTLPDMITNYRKEMAIKPLNETKDLLKKIDQAYKSIFTNEAIEALKNIVKRHLQWLSSIENKDSVVLTLIEQLQSETLQMETKDRLILLKRMAHLDARIQQLHYLYELKETMNEYQQIRQRVIQQNDTRINKLFDRKLETEIANITTQQTQHIAQLIELIYHLMSKTDARLLNEILQFISYDNQQARVLVLLMANAKVKRLFIPGMLQVVGNLNPVVSRLVNSKIKMNETDIVQYAERHPSSLATYILALA